MRTTIRARLLLLMMTVLLPGIAAALFVVARTYQGEHEAVERSLRSSALAMAEVIDRELARRTHIAQAIATSLLMLRLPGDDPDLVLLHGWCSRIVQDLGGWIELHSASQLLMDTRAPAGSAPRPHAGAAGDRFVLSQVPQVLPMAIGDSGVLRPARVVQPVRHGGGDLLNLVITLPAEVLQRVVDSQRLPANWVGTVLDNAQRVVARHPGGAAYLNRLATPDLRERLASGAEGAFTSVTLDGVASLGYYGKTSQGWAYVTAAPRGDRVADVPAAVLQVTAGALLLLFVAAAAALWLGWRIARAASGLEEAAQALQAGGPVRPHRPTGITEFDAVGQTLSAAARALSQTRHELERQVAEAVARTRQAEQRAAQGQRITALGRLTAGVAHDFNNLLGVISNSAHLIERHAGHLPAVQMPVAVTRRAIETGSKLMQQLLRFGGRQPGNPRPVDLADYLSEVSDLLQTVVRKNIAVSVAVQPGTAPVQVDPSELEMALINLALNARDAMPRGGRLRVQARNAMADETEGLPAGDYVLVAVGDSGEGLDEDLVAQVFEPFFTTKGVGHGAGLGLSQVHGFCVQAGGTARMASTPGLGSTITLLLPAAGLAQGAGPAGAAGEPAHREGSLRGTHVLLVEDHEELAEVTVLLLQSFGCVVKRARDVVDARAQIAADHTLQLVLTDVVMPGQHDGVDLARELRRTRPALPVVLISGHSAALAGLTGFTVLRKPVSADLLVLTLVNALRGGAPQDRAGSP